MSIWYKDEYSSVGVHSAVSVNLIDQILLVLYLWLISLHRKTWIKSQGKCIVCCHKKDLMTDLFNHTCDVFCEKLISEKLWVEKKHLEEHIKKSCIELKFVKRVGKDAIFLLMFISVHCEQILLLWCKSWLGSINVVFAVLNFTFDNFNYVEDFFNLSYHKQLGLFPFSDWKCIKR